MSHPEIENGLLSPEYLERREALESSTTSVDLLDVPHSVGTRAIWHKDLDHNQLIQLCQSINAPMRLRALFLNTEVQMRRDFYSMPSSFLNIGMLFDVLAYRDAALRVHPSTLEWLQARYQVSPIFLDCVVNISKWAKTGNLCFRNRDQDGNLARIEGLYRVGAVGGAIHIWFSYDLASQSAVYIISNCPQAAKDRIERCAQSSSEHIRRPFILDAFIADVCTTYCKEDMARGREPLIAYERYGVSLIPAELLSESFQNLHRLSRTWHILHEDFVDFEERLEFLIDICKLYSQASNEPLEDVSFESLSFLLSRIRIWRRWTANYNIRTKIRIDLFFNLSNQNDNRTNLDIAKTSKEIAASTLKDSSAMTTIAALTMLFLPGTFVSAVFSMVFFNATTDASGKFHLELMSSWWYFPAISVPLTIAVFLIWVIWQRIRYTESEAVLGSDSVEAVSQKQVRRWVREKVFGHQTRSIVSTNSQPITSSTHGNKTLQYHGRHHDNVDGDVPEELAYQL